MAWQTPLDTIFFSTKYQTPPPELLSQNFQPQYQATDYLTNPLAFKYQKELLNAKNAWNTAEDDIKLRQQLINQGALTDDQKQGELNKIALLKQHQQDLNNAANMTRKTARTLGIDFTGFGADNTAEESQQYFLNNNARAMQGLLNLPSVRQQQREYYDDLRRNGVRRSVANLMAARKFDEYRNNNINQLRNGFLNYGLNSDGSVNSFGMAALSRMSHEDPMTVELFSSKFAMPNNVYSAMQADKSLNSQIAARERASENNFNRDLAKLEIAQKYAMEQLEHNAALQAAKNLGSTTSNKMYDEINNLAALFGGGEEGYQRAADTWLRQNYSKSFEVAKDQNGNIKMSDAEKVQRYTDNRLAIIMHHLEKQDNQSALEAITQYRDALLSDDFKYMEQLSGEDISAILKQLDLYEKVANEEITLEQLKNPDSNNTKNKTNPPVVKEIRPVTDLVRLPGTYGIPHIELSTNSDENNAPPPVVPKGKYYNGSPVW